MNEENPVCYRLATFDDLVQIEAITKEVVKLMNDENNFQWDHAYPLRSHFEEDIKNNHLWVAVIGGEVTGFAALTIDQPPEYADVGYNLEEICIVPHRLAVSPKFRSRGLAQGFMLQAETLAKELGYPYVRVDTNAINLRMQRVFERLGYESHGIVSFPSKPKDMRFKCYQKPISK